MGILEKKLVLNVDLHDQKTKQKAMKAVSTLEGIDSITVDMLNRKMTVIGVADSVLIVAKLRKLCYTEIVSIRSAKEPKKEEARKEPAGANYEMIPDMYRTHPYMNTHHYVVYSTEEDPYAGSVMWRSSQPRHMMAGGSSGTTDRWGGGEEEMAFCAQSWDRRRGGVQYGAF